MTTPPEAGEPPLEAPPEDRKESFGTWLKRQRELREITLREIADTSKIGLRYLQALEEDRFDLLPAPVFAKGFLRQYARYVGLDPEEAVNFFLDARGQKEEKVTIDLTPNPPQTLSTWWYALAALVVALLLMALVWGLLWLNKDRTTDSGDAAGTPAAGTPAAGTPAAGTPAAGTPAAGTPAAGTPAAGTPAAGTPAAGTPAAGTPAAGTPAAGTPAAGTPLPAAAPPLPAAPLAVTLDFRGNCWVRAAVDGRPREARVYTQGESLQLAAEGRVDLELGNVFDVAAEVNGRPFPLHDGSGPAARRLTIDLETTAALASPRTTSLTSPDGVDDGA